MGENGPVTIREVYALIEKVDTKVDSVQKTLGKFHTHCAQKTGELDKRISLLESDRDKLQYMGRENRGFIFYGLLAAVSALVGAVAAFLTEKVR